MSMLSIGKVTVTTAGAIVRATVNQANPAAQVSCQSISIQALSSNAGKIYVGISTLNKSTLVGCLGILAVPTANGLPAYVVSSASIAGVKAADFRLDSDNSGEGVLIGVFVA